MLYIRASHLGKGATENSVIFYKTVGFSIDCMALQNFFKTTLIYDLICVFMHVYKC